MRIQLLIICFLLTSCHGSKHGPKKESASSFTGIAMTIPYYIVVGSNLTEIEKSNIEVAITEVFHLIDRTYNNWNPNSEISRFNQLKAYEPAYLSEELAQFMKKVGEVVELTEHLFDPTIAPIQKLWKESLSRNQTPSIQEIEQLRPAIGWKCICSQGNCFWKTKANTALDFGGIAKGHCVDLLVERLCAMGYFNIFVCWGGEVKACGQHPQGRPWKVAIKHPLNPNKPITTLDLVQRAVATSGDYEQSWQVVEDQKFGSYTHICDPYTLQALEIKSKAVISATVVAESCLLADAIATAIMVAACHEDPLCFAQRLNERKPSLDIFFIQRP